MTLDLLASGYPSIDRIFRTGSLPGPGATASLEAVPESPTFGGCGMNVAVGLSRLGFRAGAAGAVGDDSEGQRMRRHLDGEGVDTSALRTVAGAATSRSYLFTDPGGEVHNYFLAGAAEADEQALTPAGMPATRCGLVTVAPAAYNRRFVEELRRRDVPLVVQMRVDAQAYASVLDTVLEAASWAFMNRAEADYLRGRFDVESVRRLRSAFDIDRIIVTRGADGAETWGDGGRHAAEAVQAGQAVDGTGAGDAFTAGCLAARFWGLSPELMLRLGAVTASFAVEKVGAQTALPTLAQIRGRCRKTGMDGLVTALKDIDWDGAGRQDGASAATSCDGTT